MRAGGGEIYVIRAVVVPSLEPLSPAATVMVTPRPRLLRYLVEALDELRGPVSFRSTPAVERPRDCWWCREMAVEERVLEA